MRSVWGRKWIFMYCIEGFLLQTFSIGFNVKFQLVYFMTYLTITRNAIFIQIILSWRASLHCILSITMVIMTPTATAVVTCANANCRSKWQDYEYMSVCVAILIQIFVSDVFIQQLIHSSQFVLPQNSTQVLLSFMFISSQLWIQVFMFPATYSLWLLVNSTRMS
jgi:hypothetical protein